MKAGEGNPGSLTPGTEEAGRAQVCQGTQASRSRGFLQDLLPTQSGCKQAQTQGHFNGRAEADRSL